MKRGYAAGFCAGHYGYIVASKRWAPYADPRGRRSTEGAARASDCRVASPLPRPLHRGCGGRGGCVAVAERQNAVRALASETDFSHGTWSLTKLRLSF